MPMSIQCWGVQGFHTSSARDGLSKPMTSRSSFGGAIYNISNFLYRPLKRSQLCANAESATYGC